MMRLINLLPYLLMYLFLLLNVVIENTKETLSSRYIKFLFSNLIYIIIGLFICLNYLNGADWQNYESFFRSIPEFKFQKIQMFKLEPGYIYFTSLIKLLTLKYEVYQFLALSGCYIIILKTLKYYSENMSMSLIIYFVIFLNPNFLDPALRQLLSLCIFLIAIKKIENKKKYISLILLAATFHKSALILLIFPFFSFKFFQGKRIFLILFIPFFYKNFEKIIILFLSNISFFSKYLVYFNEAKLQNNENIYIFFIRLFTIISVYYFVQNKKEFEFKKNIKYEIISKGFLYYIFFYSLKYNMTYMYRIYFYFSIFFAIYISYLIKVIRNLKIKKLIIAYLSFAYLLLFAKNLDTWTYVDKKKFFPYRNYFLDMLNGNQLVNYNDKIKYRKGE